MNKKMQMIFGVGIVAIIILGAGYYIYNDVIHISIVDEKSNTASTTELVDNIGVESDGDYTIEIVPLDKKVNVPVPDLDKIIVFETDISTETQNILKQKIEEVSSELKKDSNLVDKWIELGVYRKNIGDYDGAVEVLEYALVLQPRSRNAYHNLGELYGYYIKDSVKAEESFLKAIEIVPGDIYLYFKITEFYNDVLNDTEKARQIVERGIEASPSSEDLKSLLESLNNIT